MPETLLFFSGNGLPVPLLPPLCAVIALSAMAGVAWHDCRRFEIDFTLLGVAGFALSGVIVLGQGLTGLAASLLAGAGAAAVTGLAVWWRPGRIGRGDIWLMGFLGLAAGLHLAVPVLAAFALLCVPTAAAYSRARGKPLFKSMFPVALPGMVAGGLALVLRLGEVQIAADPTPLDGMGGMDIAARALPGAALCLIAVSLGAIACATAFIAWQRGRT